MTEKEAIKLALEFVEYHSKYWNGEGQHPQEIATALREALAEQPAQQEPVTHTTGHCENHKQKGGCQLHNLQCGWPDCDRKPITAPQPEQEPVAWASDVEFDSETEVIPGKKKVRLGTAGLNIPLYTTPPQRKPLTDDEIHAIYDEVARREPYNMAVTRRNIARAIEAAHGIKEKNT